jgi:hypothetical protein
MKKLLPLLLVITPLFAFSQIHTEGTNNSDQSYNGVSFGLFVRPEYSNTIIGNNGFDESVNFTKTPEFGFTAGATTCIRTSKNFSWEVGFLFSYEACQINATQNSYYGPFFTSYNYKMQYFNLPLKINYIILNKGKYNCLFSIGMASYFLLNESISSIATHNGTYLNTNTTEQFNINEFIRFAAIGGIGVTYDISENLYLKVEPMATFLYNPPNISFFNNVYLFTLGVDVGIYLRN